MGIFLKIERGLAVVAHTFNHSTWDPDLYEFKVRLVYKVSSRTARNVTQRNPVSKKKCKGGASKKLSG